MEASAIPGWLQILAALATAATGLAAVTALVVFIQRQRDRARDLFEEIVEQAEQVTVLLDQQWVPVGEGTSRLAGAVVRVRNDSASPVTLDAAVSLVHRDSWEHLQAQGGSATAELPTRELMPPSIVVGPSEESAFKLPEDDVGFTDFVIVEFTDANHRRWRRRSGGVRSRDPRWRRRRTGELPEDLESRPSRIPRHAEVFQGIASRFEPLVRLHALLLRLAARRAASRSDDATVPGSLRLACWLWGYDPVGGGDLWLMPEGAPPWWPYWSVGQERYLREERAKGRSGE